MEQISQMSQCDPEMPTGRVNPRVGSGQHFFINYGRSCQVENSRNLFLSALKIVFAFLK